MVVYMLIFADEDVVIINKAMSNMAKLMGVVLGFITNVQLIELLSRFHKFFDFPLG